MPCIGLSNQQGYDTTFMSLFFLNSSAISIEFFQFLIVMHEFIIDFVFFVVKEAEGGAKLEDFARKLKKK